MNWLEAIRKPGYRIALVGLVIIAAVFALIRFDLLQPAGPNQFDGKRAFQHVVAQTDFGPRVTGTPANQLAGDYIASELRSAGWTVEFQTFSYQGTLVRNIVGRANVGQGPVVIVGAHYDTRRRADKDQYRPDLPVPGANDGASGVAVLLELARTLDLAQVPNELWLTFFDAEDNGELDGWDWIVGSSYLAEHLTVRPEAMLLVDMVGDADQQIYLDQNSDAALSAAIWATAAGLGYAQHFIPVARSAMLDDHTPFAQRGIPAVDIIDFDYPYWHTTGDTAEHVSPDSLERVGRTLEAFLETRGNSTDD